MNSKELRNKIKILDYLKKIKIDKDKPIILFDADRTLHKEDSGKLLVEELNLDWNNIKQYFKLYGYQFSSFENMQHIFKSVSYKIFMEGIKKVVSNIKLFPYVQDFFTQTENRYSIFIVTAGMYEIWELIFNKYKSINIIGTGYPNKENFIIGKKEKGIVAEYLKSVINTPIIAIGDSEIDSEMLLKSDIRGFVVNHRKNVDLLENIDQERIDFQITVSDFSHDYITTLKYNELFNFLERKIYDFF